MYESARIVAWPVDDSFGDRPVAGVTVRAAPVGTPLPEGSLVAKAMAGLVGLGDRKRSSVCVPLGGQTLEDRDRV
jgi:hypothetical protein